MYKLPDTLVDAFVKATNDEAPKKTESFVYGTAHVENGVVSVLFDGATDYTPCETSVSVAEGDRVSVMIKDRQAVITSNITRPSMAFDHLETGDAVIKGHLSGVDGTFTGTLRGATYEDSTSKFKMDIGSSTHDGKNVPAFKIGGYINGNSSNDYLEIIMDIWRISGEDLPRFSITGVVKSSPTAVKSREVSITLSDNGIAFYGEFPGQGNKVRTVLPWGFMP